jgi:hypothetical protein
MFKRAARLALGSSPLDGTPVGEAPSRYLWDRIRLLD